MTAPGIAVHTALSTRTALATDERFLRELFESAHPDLQLIPLPHDQLRDLIDMQLRAQRTGYATQYPHAHDTIIELAGLPVGRLLVDQGEVTTIVDIAVLPDHRNQAVASAVLADLLAAADADGRTARLTVAGGNRARSLYERLGFVPVSAHGMGTVMERRPR